MCVFDVDFEYALGGRKQIVVYSSLFAERKESLAPQFSDTILQFGGLQKGSAERVSLIVVQENRKKIGANEKTHPLADTGMNM